MRGENEKRVRALIETTPTAGAAYKNIKEKNWVVYYYLLSLSHYNNNEEHRYVYRNEFNISIASKSLGISRSHFYNSLDKLEKAGLIKKNDEGTFYQIPIKFGWASIDKVVLDELLGYSNVFTIDLLRTYLFMIVFEQKHRYDEFTKRNIIRCLGHSDTDESMYRRIDICISLLEKWELIRLDYHTTVDELGAHDIYTINRVNKSSSYLNEQTKNRYLEQQNCYGLSAEEEAELAEYI